MKLIFILLYFVVAFQLYGQNLSDSAINNRIIVLLKKFQSDTLDHQEALEIKTLTYQIQNKGFSLEEMTHDFESSLIQINKALNIWVILKDTLNEANNRKFRGYLFAHLNKFSEGKDEIFRAITLFQLKDKSFGVAVSKFDLSKVYELENKLDSALFFANISLEYWKNKKDTFRIITINNQLINLLIKTKKYRYASQIQRETKMMITDGLHWRPLIDFYYISYFLYKKMHFFNSKKYYFKLYNNKIKLLKKENIIAESTYKRKT